CPDAVLYCTYEHTLICCGNGTAPGRRVGGGAGRNLQGARRSDARADSRRARALGGRRLRSGRDARRDAVCRVASAAAAAQHAPRAMAPRRPPHLLRGRRRPHREAVQAGARARAGAAMTATCTVCELHAESTFRIEGMDCREEVAILERRFKSLAGLEDFSADLMGQRLHVKYDAAKLSAASIADAVADTGMRAWLEHEEPVVGTERQTRVRQALVWTSGVALATGLALQAAGPAVGVGPAEA